LAANGLYVSGLRKNPETTTKPYTRQSFSGHPNSRPQCHKCHGKGKAN